MEGLPSIVAIVCLTLIELMALYKGINGKLLVATSAVIAGLAGYNAGGLLTLLGGLLGAS